MTVTISSPEPELERGPWHVIEWRPNVYAIVSDDFFRDAGLELSGDFGTGGEAKAYAEAIAAALNKALPIVILPKDKK